MSAPAAPVRSPRAIARYAAVVCALALVAAVLSFVKGSWLGVVWILVAGLSSNMAWYYGRRARRTGQPVPEESGTGASRPTAAE